MTFEEYKSAYSLSGLTSAQEEAVKRADGQTLLLSVPGSGKTTVIVSRLGYMIKCLEKDADSLLTLTYSVASCKDMKQRYMYYFGEENVPEFRTIHGICALIIKYCETARNLRALTLIGTDGELSRIITEIYPSVFKRAPSPNDVHEIKTQITYAANMMLTDSEISTLEGGENLIEFLSSYKAYKDEKGIMDYDDQLKRAYKILLEDTDVLRHFREKFRYISVDEAQDTSRLQHEIIRLLAGNRGNIFMVGDEDQSIYGFRAAYPRALLDFQKIYPDGKILYMEKNFRSTGRIVGSASRLIRHNKERHKKKMVTERVRGDRIKVIKLDDYKYQPDYLFEIAKEAIGKKESTAILFRNNDSALPLISLLSQNGIPFKYRENDGLFFSGAAVSAMLSMLDFCLSPNSTELFLKLAPSLDCSLSASKVKSITENYQKHGSDLLTELCAQVAHSPSLYKKAAELNKVIKSIDTGNAFDAVQRLYNNTCFGRALSRKGYGNKIAILLALAQQHKGIPDFLRGIDKLYGCICSYNEPEEKCIILSTVHSSKGLEYDNVIIIDAIDGIFPALCKKEKDNRHLEEERRLFYVALTRAKKSVRIILCKNQFGNVLKPGRFLREISPFYL